MPGLKTLWIKLLTPTKSEIKYTEKLEQIEAILSTTEAIISQNWLVENLHRELSPREIPKFLKKFPELDYPLTGPNEQIKQNSDRPPTPSSISRSIGKLLTGKRSSTLTELSTLLRASNSLKEILTRHLPFTATAIIDNEVSTLPPHSLQLSNYFPIQWWASSPQEALDLNLILRKLSEILLLPSLLIIKKLQQAQLIQPLLFPTLPSLRQYLGNPHDQIEPQTPEQSIIFGQKRQRVPNLISSESPVLSGVNLPPEATHKAQLTLYTPSQKQIIKVLSDELKLFHQLTGREYLPITHINTRKKILIIAPATLKEQIFSAVKKLKDVGAISLHLSNPFPHRELAALVKNAREIWIADDPPTNTPLLEEKVRQSLSSLPGEKPKVGTVYFALSGNRALSTDLNEFLNSSPKPEKSPYFAGIEPFPKTDYPQRIAIIQQLKEKFPHLRENTTPPAEKLPPLTLDLQLIEIWNTPSTERQKSTARILSSLLKETENAQVIAQIDPSKPNSDLPSIERIAFSLKDKRPLLESSPSLLILRPPFTPSLGQTLQKILPQLKALLLETTENIASVWSSLSQSAKELLYSNRLKLYIIPPYHDSALSTVYLAGAALSIAEKEKWIQGKKSLQLNTLAELYPEEAIENVHSAFKSAFIRIKLLEPSKLSDELSSQNDGNPTPSPTISKLFHTQNDEPHLPQFIREITEKNKNTPPPPKYADLTDFWHSSGILYREGKEEQLPATPTLTADAIPAASAALGSYSYLRKQWPNFDPTRCSGCGLCWTSCPDGAIGATALTPKELLKSSLQISEKLGLSTQTLQMISNQIATAATKLLKKKEIKPSLASQLFRESFNFILEKLPFDSKKKSELSREVQELIKATEDIPISITKNLFHNPESKERNSGTLLVLTVDPDSCKGCGVCASVCPEEAFTMENEPTAPKKQIEARKKWELLDDTSTKTISNLKEQIGLLPALLLTKTLQYSFIPGATPLNASGTKLAIRHISTLTEYYRQSVLSKYLRDLEILRDKLTEKLKSIFTKHLPDHRDPQLLKELLTKLHSETVQPSQILALLENQKQLTAIESQQLELFAETIEKIEEIIDSIGGRNQQSRFYIALGNSHPLQLLTSFPYNPFTVPTVNARDSDITALTLGLIDGIKEKFLQQIGFIRFAYNLLENPTTAPQRKAELQKLTWKQLSPDEKILFPPILIISTPGQINSPNLSKLMNLPYPIKITLLSDGIEINEDFDSFSFSSAQLPLWSLRFKENFILQAAPSNPEHLAKGVLEGLKFPGPAIFHLYAPEPELNGFPAHKLIKNSEIAVASRIFPLFTYSPLTADALGLRLNIEDNPELNSNWATVDEKSTSPAIWILEQNRFREYLKEDDDKNEGTPLEKFLEMSPLEQKDLYPIIADQNSKKKLVLLSPLRELVTETHQMWKTLLELSGIQNPFTQKLKEKLSDEINRQKETEIEKLHRQYQTELEQLKEKITAEVLSKFQQGLLKLAGYHSDPHAN